MLDRQPGEELSTTLVCCSSRPEYLCEGTPLLLRTRKRKLRYGARRGHVQKTDKEGGTVSFQQQAVLTRYHLSRAQRLSGRGSQPHTHTYTHTHAYAAWRQPRRQLRQNRWWAVAFASRMDKLAPWERQQTKTFIAWANSFLARDGLAITNIESDLEDGIKRKRRCTRSESDVQVGPRVPLHDAQRDVSHNRRQKQRLASPSGPIRTLFVCCVCVCVCVSCGGWVA